MNDVIEVKLDDVLSGKVLTFPILDCKLITPTKCAYDIKIVECGNFCQVYYYPNRQIKSNDSNNEQELELESIKIDNMFFSDSKKKKKKDNVLKEIEPKNIIRSKLRCQRLAKANINDWKTFITLTFANNIQDVKDANKIFQYFIDKIRRVKQDLKYLCITEFQKRGAIHYHMLSNIDIEDNQLIYSQQDNQKYKHIKYWNEGFTSIEKMTGDIQKIIGYISKYMTKDIDNRLFGHRRFFSSQNLIKPIESFIDINNQSEYEFFQKKIQDKHLIYHNEYLNPYDNEKVFFLEFQKNK